MYTSGGGGGGGGGGGRGGGAGGYCGVPPPPGGGGGGGGRPAIIAEQWVKLQHQTINLQIQLLGKYVAKAGDPGQRHAFAQLMASAKCMKAEGASEDELFTFLSQRLREIFGPDVIRAVLKKYREQYQAHMANVARERDQQGMGQPGMGQQQLGMGQQQPGMGQQQPGMGQPPGLGPRGVPGAGPPPHGGPWGPGFPSQPGGMGSYPAQPGMGGGARPAPPGPGSYPSALQEQTPVDTLKIEAQRRDGDPGMGPGSRQGPGPGMPGFPDATFGGSSGSGSPGGYLPRYSGGSGRDVPKGSTPTQPTPIWRYGQMGPSPGGASRGGGGGGYHGSSAGGCSAVEQRPISAEHWVTPQHQAAINLQIQLMAKYAAKAGDLNQRNWFAQLMASAKQMQAKGSPKEELFTFLSQQLKEIFGTDVICTELKKYKEQYLASNAEQATLVAKAAEGEEYTDDKKKRTKAAELLEDNSDKSSESGTANAEASIPAAITMLPKPSPQATSAKKAAATKENTPEFAAKPTPPDPSAAAAVAGAVPKPTGSTGGEGGTGLKASVRLLLEEYLRADLDEAAVPTAMGLIVDNANDPTAVAQIFKGGGFEIVCGWLTRLVERPGASSLEVAVAAPPFARAFHAAANLDLVGPQRAAAAGAPAALAGVAAAARAVTAAVPATLLPPVLPGLLDALAQLLQAWPAPLPHAVVASPSSAPLFGASAAGRVAEKTAVLPPTAAQTAGLDPVVTEPAMLAAVVTGTALLPLASRDSTNGGVANALQVLPEAADPYPPHDTTPPPNDAGAGAGAGAGAAGDDHFWDLILAKRTPGIKKELWAAEQMIASDDAMAAALVAKKAPERLAGWLMGHCARWATGQRAMRHHSVEVLSALLRALVRLRRAAGPQGLPAAAQAAASTAAAAALALEGRTAKAAAEAWTTAKEAALALEPADPAQQFPLEEKLPQGGQNQKMLREQQVPLAQGLHAEQAQEAALPVEAVVVGAKARAALEMEVESTAISEPAKTALTMAVKAGKGKDGDAAATVAAAAASFTVSLKSPKRQRRKILSGKGLKVSIHQLSELVQLMRTSSNAREERMDALRELWDHSDDEDAAFLLGKFVELGGLAILALWLKEGMADLGANGLGEPAWKLVNVNVHVIDRLPIKSLEVIKACDPQPVTLLKGLLEICKPRTDDTKWLELSKLCKAIRKRWKSLAKEALEGLGGEGAAPTLQRRVSSEDRIIVDPSGMKKPGNAGIPKEVRKHLREKEKKKDKEANTHLNPVKPTTKSKTSENVKDKGLANFLEQLDCCDEQKKQETGNLDALSKLIGGSKAPSRKQGSLVPDYIRRMEEKKRSRLRLADPALAGTAAGAAKEGTAVIDNLAHVCTPRTEDERSVSETKCKRQWQVQCEQEHAAKRARREEVVAVAAKGEEEGEGTLLSTSVSLQPAAAEGAEVANLWSPKSPKSPKTPEIMLNAPEVKGFEEGKEAKVKFADDMVQFRIIKPEYQYYMEDPNYRGWMDHLGSVASIMAVQGKGEGALLKKVIALQLEEEEEECTAMNEGDEGYAAFLLEKKRKEHTTQQQEEEAKYSPYPDNPEEPVGGASPQLPPQAPLSDRSSNPPAPDGHLQQPNLPRGFLPPCSSGLPRGFSPGMLAASPPRPRGPRGPGFSPLRGAHRGPRGAPGRGSGGGEPRWSRMGRGPRGFPLQHQQLPRGAVPPSGGFVFRGGRGRGSGTLGGMVLMGGGRR